jgi:hypothetical protein
MFTVNDMLGEDTNIHAFRMILIIGFPINFVAPYILNFGTG